MNIKSKKFPRERCSYKAARGDFCSRHYKHPVVFTIPFVTRSIHASVIKIQRFWRLRNGLHLVKTLTPAFFVRSICHNDTEISSFDPVDSIPRAYFFAIRDSSRIWGFDIRTLVIQYEEGGKLENPYTKELCNSETLKIFRDRVELLRRWKKPLHFAEITDLTPKQSWNLRVLDMCLRLDMLGYRISTQWFTNLILSDQKQLYELLYNIWNSDSLTDVLREQIVPNFSTTVHALFKWTPSKISMKNDMDSVRRTNLNVLERLISSATQQSDKTLGAMYAVMALSRVSYRCRQAYPWLSD